VNLHRKVVYDRERDLILAGIEGSLRYSHTAHQYSQARMWWMVLGLIPGLLLNKLLRGRYLDVFVTHRASEGIQDDMDLPHRGIKAFRWLIKTFKPRLHLHGHIHLYTPIIPWKTRFKETMVVNAYGYREISWPLPKTGKAFSAQRQRVKRREHFQTVQAAVPSLHYIWFFRPP
jgi:hypothetical protein